MLNSDGPEHKSLLNNLENCLNFNLDVTNQ